MFNKIIVAAAASLALAAAPAAAARQAPAPIAPAAETVEGEQIRGGFILPLAIIALLILGYFVFVDDKEEPISP